VQAALLLADNANSGTGAHEISPAQYAAAVQQPSLIPKTDDAPPASTPKQATVAASGGVCARFSAGGGVPELAVADSAPSASGEVVTQPSSEQVGELVDRVAVPPGRGMVVRSLASPQATDGSVAVISDQGVRFAVPSSDVLSRLGYGDVVPAAFPAALVSLIPAGRALDPNSALLPAAAA
jgi:hypothetical protein